MNTQSRRRTWTAALAVSALAAALLTFTPNSASAAVLGKLNLTPATGNTSSILDIETLVPCGAGSESVAAELLGPNINPDTGGNIITGNTTIDPGNTPINEFGGYSVATNAKFFDVFQSYNITSPSGDYTLVVNCYNSDVIKTDEITATVRFTPSGGSFNATYVQLSNATATTTSLAVGPADPVTLGTSTTLTATVTAGVAGSVQFKRNGVNLGAAAPVAGGTASLVTSALPAGTNSLTATFTPTDTAANAPSTSSAVSYVVASAATAAGTARIGSTLTCNSTATPGAVVTYQWFLGTKISKFTTKSIKVPFEWKSFQAKCIVTTTKGLVSVSQTSPLTAKIAPGLAPVNTKKPVISGVLRVAKTLTCSKGSWTQSPSTFKYQWLRSGAALSGKTASTYTTTAADKGKLLTCKVSATRKGYLTGTATSAAKKIL